MHLKKQLQMWDSQSYKAMLLHEDSHSQQPILPQHNLFTPTNPI